jgi:hypothetical protein
MKVPHGDGVIVPRVITASEALRRRKILAGIMDTSEVSISKAREERDTVALSFI